MDPRFYSDAGPLPLHELVSGLNVEIPDGKLAETPIKRIASLEKSRPGDLAFLDSRKSLSRLETASASACFAPENCAQDLTSKGIVPILSAAPKAHFGRAIERLYGPLQDGPPDIHPDAEVHPTAVIGPGVRIGARTTVEPYAVINFAEIGEDCEIQSHAVIGGNGLGIAGDEQGLLSIFHVGTVRIGDRVRVGAHGCIDRAMIGETIIGDDVKLDNLVQIAHNCEIGPRCVLASFVGISGSCKVGADVKMGGMVGLADHLTIGDGVTLLARSGVMHDIPAGETWLGTPAQPAKQFMREVVALKKLAGGKSGKRNG